jgi:hypothetical protein
VRQLSCGKDMSTEAEETNQNVASHSQAMNSEDIEDFMCAAVQ